MTSKLRFFSFFVLVAVFAALASCSSSTPKPPTKTVTANPTSHNFGGVETTTISTAQDFVFTNNTSDTITIEAVTLTGANPGEFAITAGNVGLPISVPVSGTHTVTVEFRPTIGGAVSASLDVTWNDPIAVPTTIQIPLSGFGDVHITSSSPLPAGFQNF